MNQCRPDGAINLGLCFEDARCIELNIELGAECYKIAADRNHPEAALDYR
jgi:TPR repeat protein